MKNLTKTSSCARRCALLVLLLLMGLSAGTAAAQPVLENLLDPARLPYLKESRMRQVSSFDRTHGNDDRLTLQPGATAVLADVEGPGVVTRIWITISSQDPYFLRRILLRMYWDDEEHPSVEVPVGDFFGTGFEYAAYGSQFVGMSSGGYYSYFPMPFDEAARIEVVNETGQEVPAFYYHVNYQALDAPLPDDVAYFHAQWNRTLRTPHDAPYTILEAEGRGHFVGVNMSMQGYDGNLYYLEGDELIYVDGESEPSVYGTGTEDYFTSGWYFNRGPFALPYHGLILKDDSLARIAAYRFHVGDAIPFDRSFRFDIEHGHANEEVADYSSTAYWYQKEPHRPFPPMTPVSLRIPLRVAVPNGAVEAEALVEAVQGAQPQVEDMAPYGPDWSGLQQLKVEAGAPGEAFTVELPAGEETGLQVDLYYTKGPAYGDVRVLYQGREVVSFDGYHPEVYPGGRISLPALPAIGGVVPLTFEVKGQHEDATGYAVGLDALLIEPQRAFITDWNLIGPFPNDRDEEGNRLGLDTVFPPEREIDLDAAYEGAGGQTVRWTRATVNDNGRLQLFGRFEPNERIVSYAQTYVYTPEARTVPLLLGSDDGVKVLLNGEELFRYLPSYRISAPDQDRIPLPLQAGWNSLLVKVENNLGGYALLARLLDPSGDVIVSPTPTK